MTGFFIFIQAGMSHIQTAKNQANEISTFIIIGVNL